MSSLSTLFLLAALPIVQAEKFRNWFYWYDRADPGQVGYLTNLSTTVCNDTVQAYWQSEALGEYNGSGPLGWCYIVEDCMLANMRPSYIQNYQAGAVILGILVSVAINWTGALPE